MKKFFTWFGRLLRDHQFIAGLAVVIVSLVLAPFINLMVPEQSAAKRIVEWVAVFVRDHWREIALGIVALAVVRLYVILFQVYLRPKVKIDDLVVTVSTPPVTVGIHPVEVRLMKTMREAGDGPFEIEKIYEMLGVERGFGSIGVAAWVHLHNLIALKFVVVKMVRNTRAVVVSLVELYQAQIEGRQPQMKTEEYTTPLFSLSARGRYALDNLESMPNEFTTKS